MPIEVWQADDRRLLPEPRLGRGRRGDDRAAAPLQARAGPALLRGGAGAAAGAGDERRAARRLAALRGLRALSLHAGRDQERDADPARDRLSARLRRAQPAGPSGAAGRGRARTRARGERRRLGPLPAGSGERHQGAERGARARADVAASASAEEPLDAEFSFDGERRCAGGCGCGPSRSARASPGSSSASTTRASSPRAAASSSGRRRCAPACSRPTWSCEASDGRFVSPLDTDGPHGEAVAACENVNTWPVLASPGGRRGARGGDVPARPPADRAGEPRQPLRQHRDRGGAAAARADAERGGARARSPPRIRRCGR